MTELEIKQVKVDNWGIFFLQRLKHFFNRTDYCDLTLQFQDNAQLKVHRLVLSACTEYFELLERTCEMYEDCLVMPDDLQADVVVPIVNFMYTGQLEFRMDLLERLYQTSQIMNMPVLTKLLEAHRNQAAAVALKQPSLNYSSIKRSYSKSKESTSRPKQTSQNNISANKRTHIKAFGNVASAHKDPVKKSMISSPEITNDKDSDVTASPSSFATHKYIQPSVTRKVTLGEPRPTRYELPEELDTDNIFDQSFSSISYSSQPLVVHPDSEKQYKPKRRGLFSETNNSDTVDILDCTKVPKRENIYDDDPMDPLDSVFLPESQPNVTNQFFDQVLDHPGPKVTIETKDSKQASHIDHAKIISEVLKKYPHLVKSNKNIKLKILDTPSPPPAYKPRSKKLQQQMSPTITEKPTKKSKPETDYTYESDVLDSKEAARLIAMGAENVKGPWICLICGTPGKALHFASYYNFRRHLVDVHKEKPIVSMCEYCGLKSLKRNYLLHHLLTKHGVAPPPTYNFPKCNSCDYVALTESLLVKHKLSHGHDKRSYRCNVCVASYITSNELLAHIQATGHKYCDRKTNLQCIYCQKVFLRESNLFAHLKTYHKQAAKSDGIIEDSDDESREEMREIKSEKLEKYDPQSNETDTENDDMEAQYQIRPDGNLELISKKSYATNTLYKAPKKQTILNAGFSVPVEKPTQKVKSPVKVFPPITQKDVYNEEIVVIGNNEYIMRGNQLIPKKKTTTTDIIVPEIVSAETEDSLGSDYATQDAMEEQTLQEQRMIMKKTVSTNQPIQIVVSNEEEYKALMNSNHSIIFDDGDTSKTLTVLSTPETTAAMNSSLDLENTQSTDMMIIQDNYSMNVSQAIPSDNSNIVVVYSHPVDEQNKQYQIITSRDIGAQFIQPSAVISQNFQTTSSSVTDGQVIDTQTAESWQNAIQQGNQQNDEIQEIHEMSIEDHSEITQVTSHILSGLPEVSLTSVASQEVNEVILEPDIADNSKSSEIPSDNVVENNDNIDEPENVSSSMDADMPSNVIVNAPEESTPLESLPQDHTTIETEVIDDQDKPEVESPENEVQNSDKIEEKPSENVEVDGTTHIEEKIDEHIVEANEDTRATLESEEYDTSKIENVDDVQDSTQALPEEIPTEKILNLTSEWSEVEEEDEIERPDQGEENVNMQAAEDSQEMEESIENIQQEMDKQVNVSGQVDTGTDSLAKVEDKQSSTNLPIAPEQKITSLLNDWEENDSQEENASANGTVHESTENVPTEVLEAETSEISVEGTKPKKVDKIQSLVNDWDEEEEDKE